MTISFSVLRQISFFFRVMSSRFPSREQLKWIMIALSGFQPSTTLELADDVLLQFGHWGLEAQTVIL